MDILNKIKDLVKDLVKGIISELSLPEGAVDYYGEKYVPIPCYDVPSTKYDKNLLSRRLNQYHYQSLEQNKYGKWSLSTKYISLNSPIPYFGIQKEKEQ